MTAGKPAELYWFQAPSISWLKNHTFNSLTDKEYKGRLYKVDLNNQTYDKKDIITVAEAKKKGWYGINQDSYLISDIKDPRIIRV